MKQSVLLDTSFFIRLITKTDLLHQSAVEHAFHFQKKEIQMCISTISIAEFCVMGSLELLPLQLLTVLPFKTDEAVKAGGFAKVLFDARSAKMLEISPRTIIPNDAKLFAQADVLQEITHFVTSDARSFKTYRALEQKMRLYFALADIQQAAGTTF